MTTEKEIIEDVSESEDPKIYEVGFHVVPTTAEDDVSSVVNAVRDTIESLSGTIISEGTPKMIQLAYPMDHIVANKKSIFDSGYFGWVKFQAIPENILKIKDGLNDNADIFRFLIISTVKEDTFSKKAVPKIRKSSTASVATKKTPKAKEEIKNEVLEEEVDKAIEELVVE